MSSLLVAAGAGDCNIGGENVAGGPIEHVRVLADDAMEGRGLGQPGLERALSYAESVMSAIGIEPAFTEPGGGRTYRQEVPVVRYRLGPNNHAVLDAGAGRYEMFHGEGMIVIRPGAGPTPSTISGEVVYVAYGIHEPELGRDDYAEVEARGKWAVLMEGRPDDLSPELAAIYGNADRSGDRILEAARLAGVVGLVVVLEPQAYQAWNQVVDMYRNEVFAASRHYIGGNNADSDLPVIVMSQQGLEALFSGTDCDPIAHRGVDRSFALHGARLTLTTDVERSVIRSHNVAGLIRGREAPDDIVTLTAHIDHLGIRNGVIHNGANDDASGSAVVLAAMSRLQEMDLRKSVMFVLFTGEETGHFGSLHFLADPPAGTVIAGLNLEHVGRSDDGTFLTTASGELIPVVEEIAAASDGSMRAAVLDADGSIIRGSDSYSFFLHGVPTAIMGGGGFPEYHSPDDDAELVDADLLAQAEDLSVAIVARLAGEVTP